MLIFYIVFLLAAVACVAIVIAKLFRANKKNETLTKERNNLEYDLDEQEELVEEAKGIKLHNEKLKAVNETVCDALLDREEYVIALESAVETLCSLCVVGSDETGESCFGCTWKSVKDDLIKPYRDRAKVDPKAKSKFVSDNVPVQGEQEEAAPAAELNATHVCDKACSNCWKYGTKSCEGYEPDLAMECLRWELMHKKNCSNCAKYKDRMFVRDVILQGEDADFASDDQIAMLQEDDCFESNGGDYALSCEGTCKNWVLKE